MIQGMDYREFLRINEELNAPGNLPEWIHKFVGSEIFYVRAVFNPHSKTTGAFISTNIGLLIITPDGNGGVDLFFDPVPEVMQE